MKILAKSLKLATELHAGRQKQQHNLYSFMFDGAKLISVGQNNMLSTSNKAYSLGRRFNVEHFKRFPFLHAEMDSISKLWGRRYISGKETLVIIRLGAKFDLKMAKPCPSCQMVIDALGITNIFYTSEEGWVKPYE